MLYRIVRSAYWQKNILMIWTNVHYGSAKQKMNVIRIVSFIQNIGNALKGGEVGMSKKSYKRNQNRLYREIKRRIIAEQAAKFPVPVIKIHRDIETLAIKNIVHNPFFHEIEFVKMEMANKLARKLVAEGFVDFFSSKNKYAPIEDVTEIEARICVVKPIQEGR